ncbi:MAG: TIGR02452 family protein [Prevotella sp.]|nr:TIGR02452 family protein [Prevotella sp.]
MLDTKHCYETIPELIEAVEKSIANQFMVAEEDNIDQPIPNEINTRYIVSGKRSFEAAKAYSGKKVAVLNYANNHSIGGAPFSAGAQEESLCRCSTLLPCLEAMRAPFYLKHRNQYTLHEMDFMGNDDLIYTPDVVVFKTDERTIPIYPQMMERESWYKVNVITCAAPQMMSIAKIPDNYEVMVRSRIKKILDVAAKEGNEVVILGAWGCGAFKNPVEIVSRIFVNLVKNYNFEIVEFALATMNDVRSSAFARALQN